VTVYIFPGIGVDEANFVWSDADHAAILFVEESHAFVIFAFPCSEHGRYMAYRVGLGTRESAQRMEVKSMDASNNQISDQLIIWSVHGILECIVQPTIESIKVIICPPEALRKSLYKKIDMSSGVEDMVYVSLERKPQRLVDEVW
jgi:hypothetical protein